MQRCFSDASLLIGRRSLDIINKAFPSIALQDQDLLGSRHSREKFINLLADEDLRKMVRELWSARGLGGDLSTEEYWLLVEKLIERLAVYVYSHQSLISFGRRKIRAYLGSF